MRDVARNPHAVRLVVALVFVELGLGSVMVAIPYLSELLTGETGNSSLLMLGFVIPCGLSIPLWIPLTRRFGKARCWTAATGLCAASCYALGAFGLDSAVVAMCIAAPIGIGQAAMMTIPMSIKADVIHWDEAHTGERKEGSYFAAWNLIHKFGSGLSVAIVGFAIQGPSGSVDPDGVRFVLTNLPAACLTISTILLLRFRFGEREHTEIRRKIGQRLGRDGTAVSGDSAALAA